MTLVDNLKNLITFRTVTGKNDEISRAYDWVEEQLRGLPVFTRRHEWNGVPSMIITTRENQKCPKVWLLAHMDVVDGSEKIWSPREENGRLIGRGSFDMKFAIACYIELFRELGDSLSEYDVGIMLTGDEEVGGFNSVKKLLEEEDYRGEAVFLPDGGGAWQFEEAAKGMWAFELVARGSSVHSSRPWEGESAIQMLSHALTDLYALAQEFWLDTPDHWHLTINPGMISGGKATNQVADEARVTIDVRPTSEEERLRFETRVHALLAKYPRIERRDMWNEAPYGISRDFLMTQSFARIAKEHHDIECGWTKSHGSSDARHFALHGIPSLLIWPQAGGAHGEEEWIDVADFKRFYAVMRQWVQEETRVRGAAATTATNA